MEKIVKPKLTPVLDTLESAVKIWFKNLKKIVLLYLWGLLFAAIPVAIILFFGGMLNLLGNRASFGLGIAFIIISIAGFLVAIYFSIRAYMSVFLLVKKNYEGKELDIYKETKKLFWPYLGLTVLTTIFIILWTMLLIIPGIIYSVFYSLAVYVFFFEGDKGMAAIRRSISLVKNYWWEVFGRYAFVGLVFWLFGVVIAAPLSFTAENSFFYSFWGGVVQAINFLVGPIVLLYSYQIYQDLVKIKK